MCSANGELYAVKPDNRICKAPTIWTTTNSKFDLALAQAWAVRRSALLDRRKTSLPIPLAVQLTNQRMIAVDPVLINLAVAVTHAVHPFEAQRHISVRPRGNPADEYCIAATRVVGDFQPEIRNVAQQFMQRPHIGLHAFQRRVQARPISFDIRRQFIARPTEIRSGPERGVLFDAPCRAHQRAVEKTGDAGEPSIDRKFANVRPACQLPAG